MPGEYFPSAYHPSIIQHFSWNLRTSTWLASTVFCVLCATRHECHEYSTAHQRSDSYRSGKPELPQR
ncbi:hypothetical protein FIBSPDRAFT_858313 [Athelia psychrophila]|uniref:Uncharacterized protein n=1 Tax=Athelia psychrophila TaxID=1759441 RepID=A0A165X7M1_9AGAM|nr:hypothetical protein FIBSPDRAFT_874703 [Fibularhizoctonia sp. CBS 109695]KZP23401.1 hypothetical protein FIBSPDRAFT_858313 [Fibularhizoctonia sp. CBS 109695]